MVAILENKVSKIIKIIEEKYLIDISIMILLCVVAQHSFVIKFFGIFILVLLHWKAILKIDLRQIPLFYTIVPSLEIIKFFLLDPNFSSGHIAQFVVGMAYWVASIICFFIIFQKVNEFNSKKIENTIVVFAILNFIFSAIQLLKICYIEGVINPYNTGHDLPYGISTGDLIKGVLNGLQISNGFISSLLVLFFAHKKRIGMMIISLIPFLLCGSNYITIVLLFSLGLYFLFSKNNKYAFSIALVNTIIIVVFYTFVTPLNGIYTYEKVMSIIYSKPIKSEVTAFEDYRVEENKKAEVAKKQPVKFYNLAVESGKNIAYNQSLSMMRKSPKYFLFGTGMGGFSSNIAFNFSGVVDNSAMARTFPHYETPYFAQNHKKVYSEMKSMNMIFHSESNKPFSFYNQLLGEYGIVGFLLFFIFYVGYFLKRLPINGYTISLFCVFLFALHLYYYLELLNLFLFFEVLLFLNIAEKKAKKNV